MHGANRLGGNSLLEGAYFGKIAGTEAAARARRVDYLPIDFAQVNKEYRRINMILDEESHFNINAMRKNLGETLFKKVGVYREEETLISALEYVHYLMKNQFGLHCVNKERHNNVELSAILEFRNALIVAEAMILCAIKREESRGVHFRNDFPDRDDKVFGMSSYVKSFGGSFLKISFENDMFENFFYKIKTYFNKLKG